MGKNDQKDRVAAILSGGLPEPVENSNSSEIIEALAAYIEKPAIYARNQDVEAFLNKNGSIDIGELNVLDAYFKYHSENTIPSSRDEFFRSYEIN